MTYQPDFFMYKPVLGLKVGKILSFYSSISKGARNRVEVMRLLARSPTVDSLREDGCTACPAHTLPNQLTKI